MPKKEAKQERQETNMKNKTNTKKKSAHYQTAKKTVQPEQPVKKMLTDYYLIPQEVCVMQIAELLPDYQEKAEIWREMDLLELTLTHDTMVFEEAAEDFENQEDQVYFEEHKICTRCRRSETDSGNSTG